MDNAEYLGNVLGNVLSLDDTINLHAQDPPVYRYYYNIDIMISIN